MADAAGTFIWYELLTTDIDAAARFYGELVGWTAGETVPMGDLGDYKLFDHGDEILIATDPQGAMFALVATQKESAA